ncbi:S1 RNA-binding domain-containing protein [Engelhardtia mirabilis]|uniref:30S ribosomal protein S1 n=1 Tax=Engelhardtia mirabilis TaxID=2528011 RepID=A0A518BLE8_9BACT|nr:30S ribosomal protein S1 [Planctomycetes bacterium Pla133]QDV02123.1 30S ribosomal protein S1 [Planctomycetes bacterium Pla86]
MARRRSKPQRVAQRPSTEVAVPTPEHGAHTLGVWRGTIVGRDRSDLFVELGPRMQGVLRVEDFDQPPSVGETVDVTLHGREEGLWILSPSASLPLASWERAQIGDLVEARLLSATRGGFDARVGKLHGFLPFSASGLGRRDKPETLLGRALPCEVVDVDTARQRVTLSHKRYLARLAEARAAAGARLRPGQTVRGRVAELVPFGAFVDLGQGVRGLLHRSNIAYERVLDPAEHLSVGESIELLVLSIRDGGRRVALGLKQRFPSPWAGLARRVRHGELLRGEVVDVVGFGLFVRVVTGVVGLVHQSELGLAPGMPSGHAAREGDQVVVRVLALDAQRERLSLSLTRADGSRLDPEEHLETEDLERLEVDPSLRSDGLGRLLHAALRERTDQGGSA